MNDQKKKIFNIIAMVAMGIIFLIGLLIPMPYLKTLTGEPLTLFENEPLVTVLFELFMASLFTNSFLVYYNTKILTYRDIRDSVKVWSKHDSVKNIHSMVNPLIEILTEAESMTKEELAVKKAAYAKSILTTWSLETKANAESVEAELLGSKQDVNVLLAEIESLREYKRERDKITAENAEDSTTYDYI